MIVALWAALAMLAQDVFGTLMVQAQARNRAVLSGLLDVVSWLCVALTLSWSLGAIEHGWDEKTIVIVVAVSMANFVGSWMGVKIGQRLIRSTDPSTSPPKQSPIALPIRYRRLSHFSHTPVRHSGEDGHQ